MKYVIVDKQKAIDAGISSKGTRQKNGKMIITEKTLDIIKGGTLEERASVVDGKIYTDSGIMKIIKRGGWL